MKYCLSGRQSKEYLQKADEIMVDWNNGKTIFDIIQINPNARIIVRPTFDQTLFEENYKWLEEQKTLCHDNFAIACMDDEQANQCKKHNLDWFFAYPCRTFLQLRRAMIMGATDAYIADELCHSLDIIEEYFSNITIRVVANSAGWGTIEGDQYLNGVCGSWFRPEDLWLIDQIDVCEFKTTISTDKDPILQEQALYKIYAEKHQWQGRVDDFVYDIKRQGLINRLFNDDFQWYRNNCGMKCLKFGRCHYCETYANLAQDTMAYKIKQHIEKL